jgi:hypothetical protein
MVPSRPAAPAPREIQNGDLTMTRNSAIAASTFLAAAAVIGAAALITHVKAVPAVAAVSAIEATAVKETHARGLRSAPDLLAVITPADGGSVIRRGATNHLAGAAEGEMPATSVARR